MGPPPPLGLSHRPKESIGTCPSDGVQPRRGVFASASLGGLAEGPGDPANLKAARMRMLEGC